MTSMAEKFSSASSGSIGGHSVTVEQDLKLDEFWRVMRKLSGPRAMLVVEALLTGNKMTRKELYEKLGIEYSQLNHELDELIKLHLIIKDEETKTYQITVYCKLFMYVLDDLLINLAKNKDILLKSMDSIDPVVLKAVRDRGLLDPISC
jgi:transcription initiation factor IIE alpha subunit